MSPFTTGYYKEYEVPNTPNYTKSGAGPERIITGKSGEGVAIAGHGYSTASIATRNLMNDKGGGTPKTPGQISQEKYLKGAKNKGYIDYIKNIYREKATEGNGSTADYYRKFGDEGHKLKMEIRIKQGEKLLSSGKLDSREAANVRLNNNDMRNALSGN